MRSLRLNNVHNWNLVQSDDGGNPALLEAALGRLARRDCVSISEGEEWVNFTPGWSKITPQSLKALNPSIKVYRYYSLLTKATWEVETPTDVRLTCPIPLAEIEQNDWWMRDGDGDKVHEPDAGFEPGHSASVWYLDVGKPGFKEMFLDHLLVRMDGKGFDGVVFDVWWPEISPVLAGKPRPAAYPTDQAWFDKAWKPFLDYVMDGIHKQSYRIIGNCAGEYGWGSSERQYQRTKVDGTVYEQLALSWSFEGGDWLPGSVIERRINALALDPLEIWTGDAALSTDPEYDRKQLVSLAVYYCGLPQDAALRATRSYHHTYDETAFWQPLWDFDIGEPVSPSVRSPGYCWSRQFTEGRVFLNYSTTSWWITKGWSIPAHSAAILKTPEHVDITR